MEDEKSIARSTFTFTYHDPSRSFDGTAYEAAAKAVLQVDSVAKLLQRAIIDANTQARNSYMQRNMDLGGSPDAENWDNAAEARIIAGQLEIVSKLRKKLPAIMRAVAYDPKNPPKED